MEFEVMPRIPVATKSSTKSTTSSSNTSISTTVANPTTIHNQSTQNTRIRPFYELRPQKLIPNIKTESIPNVDHTRKISTESSSNGNQSINVSPSPPSPTSSLPSPLTVDSTIAPQVSNNEQDFIDTAIPNTINNTNNRDEISNHIPIQNTSNDHVNGVDKTDNTSKYGISPSHSHKVELEDFEEDDPLFGRNVTTTMTSTISQHRTEIVSQQQSINRSNFTKHKFLSTTAVNDRRHTEPIRPTVAQRSNSLMPRSKARHSLMNIPRQSQFHTIDKDNNPIASEVEKWRNSIISKRELKKKRKELLEDGKVLVGNKVSEGHSNYTMAYNMLTGIRVSVSRVSGARKPLTNLDFTTTKKLAFDVSGSELTPSSKYDFKFKDYAPTVFRELRLIFGLDPADYLVSLTSKYILSELGSPGKSGSFFYYSRDYRFIIKTIHHSEHRQLRLILKDYYHYVKENPNTLISQFYGLHRLKMRVNGRPKKVHFLVMNNLFPLRPIHRQYDLKGSTDGRYTRKDNNKNPKKMVVYKDLNWLEDGYGLKLKSPDKQKIVTQLKKDVRLLQKLNIMDYSMLIGVHDCNLEPKPGEDLELEDDDRGFYQCLKSDDDDYIYYIGVIDCLTRYSTLKHLETWMRRLERSKNFSCINANAYGERFINFMENNVFKKDKVD